MTSSLGLYSGRHFYADIHSALRFSRTKAFGDIDLPHAPETGNKAKTHHVPAQILLFSEGRHIHDPSKASELLNALW